MSEDKLREQFEAWWFSGEIKSPILVSEHSMFFADQAWQACAKIKDDEIAELKAQVAMFQEASLNLTSEINKHSVTEKLSATNILWFARILRQVLKSTK